MSRLTMVNHNFTLTILQCDVKKFSLSKYSTKTHKFLIGDSGQKMGVKCSNCIASGNRCTHAELAKVRMCRVLRQLYGA